MRIPLNYDASKYRNWHHFEDPETCKKQKVSVMSFNLLSRHYMWKPVFGYLEQEYLSWSDYRFPLINLIIRQFNCDIMCFQEMEHLIYKKFWSKDFPSSKYRSFYARKLEPVYWGDRPSENIDGVGIFVNGDKFDVLDSQKINFGEYIMQHHTKFNVTRATIERVIPRNTVALLVKLCDKRNGKILYVTNTHLYWSPKFNDVKIIQTKLLLNVLRDFIGKDCLDDPCIIMCGDFNSNPSSKVFQLLNTGKIDAAKCNEFALYDYNYKANSELFQDRAIKNPFHLACAYELLLLHSHSSLKKRLEFTSFTKSLFDVVDHIWYSKNHFKVTKLLGEVEQSYYTETGVVGFPNSQFPSDHIPLVTELAYL
ncbi:uncharacterized protein AC631_02404 [Debaryomyces fabryi]|uniref:Endonuclease/exonuclease/phosphatase domain-containing protein n=1 Tax=Debaryomyces fabryi TaxID=58627 RepID=A0A0V1Q112_9ASCO|nr:uncharacterized protein AC631_02404 [Debaryomyces fabryi]KSA01871.1 hypothetical protein AC631_02404 [Debaryomyces fabryi]